MLRNREVCEMRTAELVLNIIRECTLDIDH